MNKSLNNKQKIWVTQSLPRGNDSAADFKSMGLNTISSPLLNIVINCDMIETPKPQTHLIFTARNGVRAFAQRHAARDYPVICVGDATAKLALDVGFTDVTSAGGDASDVVDLIEKTVPQTQPVLHCAGRHVRGEIVETLCEKGYQAKRVEYYASKPVETLPLDVSDVNYIAFYSPLAAKTFTALVDDVDVSHIKTLSISAATDAPLRAVNLAHYFIAASPDQNAMINALKLDLQTATGLD